MHFAMMNKELDILKILDNAGANNKLKNVSGDNIIDIAVAE